MTVSDFLSRSVCYYNKPFQDQLNDTQSPFGCVGQSDGIPDDKVQYFSVNDRKLLREIDLLKGIMIWYPSNGKLSSMRHHAIYFIFSTTASFGTITICPRRILSLSFQMIYVDRPHMGRR